MADTRSVYQAFKKANKKMTIIFFPNIGLSVGLDYMPAEDGLPAELMLHLFIFKLSISWQ